MVRCILIFLLLLVFSSCSNLTLEKDPLEIKAISDGSQLTVGDSVIISIDNNSSDVIPTQMIIKITNIDATSREISNIEPIVSTLDLTEFTEAKLIINKDFADGLYLMEISVSDDIEVVKEEKIEFSVFSGQILKEVVGVLPSKGLYTDSKVLLQSKVTSNDVDPYLIWTYDDEIIKQGYLSGGLDSIVWDSEDFLGFNEIKLELLPYKFTNYSPSNDFILFSTVVNDIDSDLFDLENYYRVFLFNGNYIDEEDKSLTFETFGEITPRVEEGYYGLLFNSQTGFTSNKSYMPYNENGILSNSLILELHHLNYDDGNIFIDSFNDIDISLYVKDKEVRFNVTNKDIESLDLSLYYLDKNNSNKIVISAVVNNNEVTFLFYVNGYLVDRRDLMINPFVFESVDPGSLRIGGLENDNAEFIIDSLKVYFKDILEEERNNIYSEVFYDKYGEYTLGSGFNSLYVPDEVVGHAAIDGEILALEKDSSIDLSKYLGDLENYTLHMELKESGGYSFSFLTDDVPQTVKLVSSLDLKRRGSDIFINGDKYKVDSNNMKVVALEALSVDSVVVQTREIVEEL